MKSGPPFDVGDIVEWMGAPVLCISTPRVTSDDRRPWVGLGAYLRRPGRRGFNWQVGEVRDFNFGPARANGRDPKRPWREPLTEEEQALAMRLLLTGG